MKDLPAPGTTLLLASEEQTWRTRVLAVNDSELLLDAGELLPESLCQLAIGSPLQCRYHEHNAMGSFATTWAGIRREGNRPVLCIAPPGNVSHSQRRQHMRVLRRLPIQLRLPLKNDALSKSLGRDAIYSCWVEATAVNISAGGFRALLVMPRQHSIVSHQQAQIRFELGERHFTDRNLAFIRRDWSTDEPLLVYRFTDLDTDEIRWLEASNCTWLQGRQQLPSSKGDDS